MPLKPASFKLRTDQVQLLGRLSKTKRRSKSELVRFALDVMKDQGLWATGAAHVRTK